jgi:hypothetical protein
VTPRALLAENYRAVQLLHQLATRVINDHVDDRGQCPVCRTHWPCERVQLAAGNLYFDRLDNPPND